MNPVGFGVIFLKKVTIRVLHIKKDKRKDYVNRSSQMTMESYITSNLYCAVGRA